MECAEQEILQGFRKGDPESFRYIYDTFYVSVYLKANRYLKSEEEAKDIRARCFTKFWELHGRLEFNSMGDVYAWLNKTVSNSCIDFLRRQNLARTKTKIIYSKWVENDKEIYEADEKEAAIIERLLKQIDQLPPKFKQVLKMRWLNDLKFREIAEQLGADVSTIKKRYARAITLLKRTLI